MGVGEEGASEGEEVLVFTRTLHVAPLLDMKYDGLQRRKLVLSVASHIDGEEGPAQESALTLPVRPSLFALHSVKYVGVFDPSDP